MSGEMSFGSSNSAALAGGFALWEQTLNKTIPFVFSRWISFGALLLIFMLRVLTYQGFYVIAYALGIFLLNGFLAFLSPRFDPDLEGLSNDALLSEDQLADLPVASRGSANAAEQPEFRPFARRLPEFQFWYLAIRAAIVSLFLALFPAMDIPVYWPILLIYFVVLVGITMRRQIRHMIKYKYIPFDIGKVKYTSTTANVK